MRITLPKRPHLAWLLCVSLLLSTGARAEPELLEASIEELQAWLTRGDINSEQLVRWYLDRIRKYDQQGPKLNAIQHVNGNALQQAMASDAERQQDGCTIRASRYSRACQRQLRNH